MGLTRVGNFIQFNNYIEHTNQRPCFTYKNFWVVTIQHRYDNEIATTDKCGRAHKLDCLILNRLI